jgi:ABC-type antimicrobial peptide transport system permease subunit
MSETTDTSNRVVPQVKKEPPVVNFLKRLVKEKPMGTVGGVIVLVMLLTGIFANFLAPYGRFIRWTRCNHRALSISWAPIASAAMC